MKKRKHQPEYIFKDGRLPEVKEMYEQEQGVIPTPEEAVRRGFQKAPGTILGLSGGGILGGLIAGPLGALLGGVFFGLIGFNADQAEREK